MSNPILSKSKGEKVSSPEQLNDYIKVSNVGVWIILSVLFVLLVSVFVWATFGSVTEDITTVGVAQNGTVTCYVEDISGLQVGNEVHIGSQKGAVSAISKTPLSKKSVSEKYDEYTAYCLNPAEWNYEITVECASCKDGMQTLYIIYNSVHPISFLKG